MVANLVNRLGIDLLSYLLNFPVRNFSKAGSLLVFTNAQKCVLEKLRELDREYAEDPFGDLGIESRWRLLLSTPVSSGSGSVGNELRLIAGGAIEEAPEGVSGLEEILSTLAICAYPATLLKRTEENRTVGSSVSLHGHALNQAFQELVMEDATLRAIYTRSRHAPHQQVWVFTPDMGNQEDLPALAGILVGAGLRLALFDYAVPSPAQLVAATLQSLELLRKSLSGQQVSVPVRIGLTGVLLPEGVEELSFPWGRLRNVGASDRVLIQSTLLEGSVRAVDGEGNGPTISYAGDLILETTCPYYVRIVHPIESDSAPPPWPEGIVEISDELSEKYTNLALGLKLACQDSRPTVVRAWHAIANPLSHGLSMSVFHPDRTPNLMPKQLTLRESSEWRRWAIRLGNLRIPEIDIAIRRALMAAIERETPDDRLVDAVIGWENLFGAREKTVSTVTRALAALLAPHRSATDSLRRHFAEIYDIRSRVVHGNQTGSKEEIRATSWAAVDILVDALGAIFTTHTHLLRIPKSNARGRVVAGD